MTRRVLTPVTITERWCNPLTGRTENWAAESRERAADGEPLWTYLRIEDGATLWEVRRAGSAGFALYGSLTAAREATADGRVAAIEPRDDDGD